LKRSKVFGPSLGVLHTSAYDRSRIHIYFAKLRTAILFHLLGRRATLGFRFALEVF